MATNYIPSILGQEIKVNLQLFSSVDFHQFISVICFYISSCMLYYKPYQASKRQSYLL